MQQLPDIPAFRHASRISTDPDLGPGVPTILVIAGKNDCNTECQGRSNDKRYATMESILIFQRRKRRQFAQTYSTQLIAYRAMGCGTTGETKMNLKSKGKGGISAIDVTENVHNSTIMADGFK